MTDQTEPIRRSELPPIPPPEWEFHTWFPHPDGSGDMVPGQRQRGVLVRRRVSYGDWEPVRPDRWADEPEADVRAVSSAGPAPATDRNGLPPEATWMFGAAEIETRPEMNVTPLPDETDVTEPEIDGMMLAGVPVQIVTAPPATYAPTGHLVTCFAVAGGNPDPDCPCAAVARPGQPETGRCCGKPAGAICVHDVMPQPKEA